MTAQSTVMTKRELLDAHKSTPQGLMFYASLSELRADRALVSYLHPLTRAWHDLDLDGVLCLEGLPTLYLTIRHKRVSAEEAADLQRRFWNQGLATILVIVDTVNVRVYSGLSRPIKPQDVKNKPESLVEVLNLADYAMNIQSFMLQLATGSYYRSHVGHFHADSTVDAYLLNNLRATRDKLIGEGRGLAVEAAHTILARTLFVCYLTDRKIIDLGDFQECRCASGTPFGDMLAALTTDEDKQRSLCGLFSKLKDDFNGSMFEPATLAECRQLNRHALNDLTHFLQGHEGTGQYTLDFWAYDFHLIPVETISAVYEDFLKKEDEPTKRTKGAYYTPRFLAETVIDLALRGQASLEGKRFLDPACGSGIFLVTLFNRLSAIWMMDHSKADYGRKADALKAILRDQLCGVDENPTACRIACFSLYLAFLDCFDPPDIKSYISRKGKLPSILKYRDPTANTSLAFPVIHEDDFLNPSHDLPKDFDFVVGNPPWSGRGAAKGLHHRFAQKIPEYLSQGGTGCILLPSKSFLNEESNRFQEQWLRTVTLEEVVQLADYSFILFKEAKCPCMIVRFRAAQPDLATASVEYVAPKVTRIDYRDGIIPVAASDRKEIPLRQVLAAARGGVAPSVWKQYLWGTPRDIKFLEMLQQMPRLDEIAGSPEENKRWVKGQGFQPFYPEKAASNADYPKGKETPWSGPERFIPATRDFPSMILLPADCIPLNGYLRKIKASENLLRRSPSKQLFQPPLVIISQGIGKDAMPKIAFSNDTVIFQDSLQAISGQPADEDLLLFLTVYLRSKLAKYFLFHTSANWGTERDKILFMELLRIPFPLPGSEYVHRNADEIVRQVAQKVRSLKKKMENDVRKQANVLAAHAWQEDRSRQVDALQANLEPLIYKYFDLIEQEIILIEDAVDVAIPSATPGYFDKPIPSRARVRSINMGSYSDGLAKYAETLSKTLNEWAAQSKSTVRTSMVGGIHEKTDMACMTVELTGHAEPFKEKAPSAETIVAVNSLAQSAASRVGGLDYLRGIIVFDGSRIHIFKPTALIGWTRTAALNDAAEIYARIANARHTMQNGDV
ncbi:MAG TPA: hypothetical protein DCZ95_04965 [Verrucomicrobia bacterium]|nr:MAG: hypothetical protein A2X46_14845 [Lentisphaerae bacterium GWF2_57_35]HBA83428.1 hypothetical protein [Verrucomicrobiota bacterium]